MPGGNVHYASRFADNWGFFLGYGENLQRIDNPGRWEDILFTFSRDHLTGTLREEMSYTLQFRGNGGEVLRKRITGLRNTASLVLEVRLWHPLSAEWEVYYRGLIDDGSIKQHADYVEAATKPVGVAQDLTDKADTEYTVQLTGKRIEVPRVWAYASFTVASSYANTPQPSYPLFSDSSVTVPSLPSAIGMVDKDLNLADLTDVVWGANLNPSDIRCLPKLDLTFAGGASVVQPYFPPSAIDGVYIVAQSGTYRITNNIKLRLALYLRQRSGDTVWHRVPSAYTAGVNLGRTPRDIADVPANQTFLIVGNKKISGGDTQEVVLTKGDTIKVCACKSDGNPMEVVGLYQPTGTPTTGYSNGIGRLCQFAQGSAIIQPIDVRTPLTAPAVRDIDLFAQLCRQATRRPGLIFDFSRYRPAYFSNPDDSMAAVFFLCLSRLKESLVAEDGTVTPQGTDEAYFKGLTLNMFYQYFLAQGFKVGVEDRLERGKVQPVVFVAPYCATAKRSYFYPSYDPETSPVIADLGTAVTDIELSRYERTFLQVVAGSDPEDFGAFPREEGYQDPCNRRITYGIGIENPGEAYNINVPFPLTTLGLEEELQRFEGESDEARQQRWTEGEGIHLVCGSAGEDGQITAITQYPALPGLFYKPLNLGFRPECLMRRNLPLLCMSLAPFDMDDTYYEVEELEGDDISVTAHANATGDAWLEEYTTEQAVTETADEQAGLLRPVMITFRSATKDNIYARLTDNGTRYGVVRFRYKGRQVAGYLRAVDLNPTELSVQKWEILPVWSQALDFLER